MKFETEADLFGLTGGMGSGKSTVSAKLGELGAVIVDADLIVHELQAPNMPVLEPMAEILGDDILDAGVLNRKLAGERMFADPAKRQAIQAFLSPLIWGEMANRIEAVEPDGLIILDVPLLIEAKMTEVQGIVVVDTSVEVAVERLQKYRGFSEAEAHSRIARQVSREERLSHADYVIANNGTPEELNVEIDRAWDWLSHVRGGYITGV